MNNTALRAEVQSTSNTHMVFANEKHDKFYFEKLEQVRYQDCYHKALIYILGISEDTRNHFSQIYDIKSGYIKTECLHQGWQTSECREYSVSDIFCCGYVMYFWQDIQLRYPEYCQKQKSIEEILAEMKEKKSAENSTDGNKE